MTVVPSSLNPLDDPCPITRAYVDQKLIRITELIRGGLIGDMPCRFENLLKYYSNILERILLQGCQPPKSCDPSGDVLPEQTLTAINRMNKCVGESSFENPILVAGGCRIFDDGFIPTPNNFSLVCTILGFPEDRPEGYLGPYYAVRVGETTPFTYTRGGTMEWVSSDDFPITKMSYSVNGDDWLRAEFQKSLDALCDFIRDRKL